MVKLVILVAALIAFLWLLARFYLAGSSYRRYEQPEPALYSTDAPSIAHVEVVTEILQMHLDMLDKKPSFRERVELMRAGLDEMGDRADLSGIRLDTVKIGNMDAEWVMVEGVMTSRRLLYLHGGAFMAGSPVSHRNITTALARTTRSAVLVIDYRLLPEHNRFDTLADCQQAYRWILENGPQGAGAVDKLLLAGDSAGGNLALVVSAWARDEQLRQPDAVIALSPATDGTVSGASMRSNVATDPMLGPTFGKIMRMPRSLLLWISTLTNRALPRHLQLSPLHGDLAGLAPTLIHVSAAEILYDDAKRYANKAVAAGSPVMLQVWPHTVHVWHIYQPDMPEAVDAFAEISRFVERQLGEKTE